jgi:hypothetical protein
MLGLALGCSEAPSATASDARLDGDGGNVISDAPSVVDTSRQDVSADVTADVSADVPSSDAAEDRDGSIAPADAGRGVPGPIYPTKPGGREWFLNSGAPTSDGQFESQSAALTRNTDGTWRVSRETDAANSGIRMSVHSPAGTAPWLNIEMTGYVKLVSFSFDEELAWRTRSGDPHSDPCLGHAYYGLLRYNGSRASVAKEVWHNSGYVTGPGAVSMPTAPLRGRWVGFKMIVYNVDGGAHVKSELWLDDAADDRWVKLLETVDDGWATTEPFPAGSNCRHPITGQPTTLDQIWNMPQPLLTFRADNATLDFDRLSVREIVPPSP